MSIELPGFVDVVCDPGFPGFPVRETPARLCAAARSGGFTDLVLSPRVDPCRDTPETIVGVVAPADDVRFHATGAITTRLAGTDLAEVGMLHRAGVVALSDGGVPHRDSVVLRNLLEYVERFGLPLILRPADAELDALGVVHESPLAARLGLRGNPSSAEEVGVQRILALVRRCRTKVHLTHIGSRWSVALIRQAQADGLPVTASTPARNLLLDETVLDDGSYDARFRVHPPLRGEKDRLALVDAVRDGVLWLCADHQPRAPEEKEHEFERCVPGSTGLETAFAAALTALGDLDLVVAAMGERPRAWFGLPPGLPIRVDPHVTWEVDASRHTSLGRNDALHGRRLRGCVVT